MVSELDDNQGTEFIPPRKNKLQHRCYQFQMVFAVSVSRGWKHWQVCDTSVKLKLLCLPYADSVYLLGGSSVTSCVYYCDQVDESIFRCTVTAKEAVYKQFGPYCIHNDAIFHRSRLTNICLVDGELLSFFILWRNERKGE